MFKTRCYQGSLSGDRVCMSCLLQLIPGVVDRLIDTACASAGTLDALDGESKFDLDGKPVMGEH